MALRGLIAVQLAALVVLAAVTVWSVAYTLIGYVFGRYWNELLGVAQNIGYGLVALVALTVLFYVLRRRRKNAKKEEEAAAQAPPEKPWWVVEAETLAAVAAACGNPEEFPGEHLIRSWSVNEDYRQVMLDDLQTELWSAMDSGAIVDLAGPFELPAPKEEEDSFHFSDDDDDGDDADSLDWSAFGNRRR